MTKSDVSLTPMPIITVHSGQVPPKASIGPHAASSQKFSTVLAARNKPSTPLDPRGPRVNIADKSGTTATSRKGLPISLGKISQLSPSVSHLLMNHPELQDHCWDIIFSSINQGKPFTNMVPGVEVFLDPESKEISWQKTPPQPVSLVQNTVSQTPNRYGEDSSLIKLGTIGTEHPTLSHLLKDHPDYSDKAWDIIFSPVNRNKPYVALSPESEVYIDSNTLELSFQKTGEILPDRTVPTTVTPNETALLPAQPAPGNDSFAKKLAASVKSYLGHSYQKIDCYELVVRGLEDLGVQYGGKSGLRQHLVGMAAEKGLRHNAYHNGEGLIEAAGNKLFAESFVVIKNAEQQALEVMNRIKPLLQEGMLLSFSTPTRGHTGVISQKNGQWTYVNSGVIDHQVDGGKAAKRVGEETLALEIKNWFKLAQNKRTSLIVSAGVFDTEKLKEKARLAGYNVLEQKDMI